MTGVTATFEYELAEAVAGSFNHYPLGAINFSFPAGTVVPKSEQEETVLEQQLVPAGLATRGAEVSGGKILGGGAADGAEPEDGGAPPARPPAAKRTRKRAPKPAPDQET